VQWAVEQGAVVSDNIDLFHEFETTGRGVKATRDLPKGELLLSVPPGAYMEPPCKDDDELDKIIMAHKASSSLGIVLRLMHEVSKGPASTFAAHIATMFEVLPDTPSYWDEADRAELRGSAAMGIVDPKIIIDEYEKCAKPIITAASHLFPEPHGSLKAFMDASTACTSRWFRMEKIYQSKTSSRTISCMDGGPYLVPVADMFNHHHESPHASFSNVKIENKVTFKMFLDVPVKAGEQIFLTYGNLNNQQLLHGYGYVPQGNEALSCALVPAELVLAQSREDVLAALKEAEAEPEASEVEACKAVLDRKEAALKAGGCLPDEPYCITREDMIPEELLTVAQVMHMDVEMFECYEEEPAVLGSEFDVEDDEYVTAVERTLLCIVDRKLRCYASTYKEDRETVKTAQGRLKAALEIRLPEQRLLLDLKAQLIEDAGATLGAADLALGEEDEEEDTAAPDGEAGPSQPSKEAATGPPQPTKKSSKRKAPSKPSKAASIPAVQPKSTPSGANANQSAPKRPKNLPTLL